MSPTVTCVVPARVGLVGNPSDGYGGAVLATTVPNLTAAVQATPGEGITIIGPAGTETWPTPAHFLAATRAGHAGEHRLITAALAVAFEHLATGTLPPGITVAYTTTIPRAVGLAGSSALAVAVIDAVHALAGDPIDRRVLAALALRAERDVLGITAGWQDRMVQAQATTVLVDCAATESVGGMSVPIVTTLGPGAGTLVVGWDPRLAVDSDGYHAAVRANPGADQAAGMRDLADLARSAATAWAAGDAPTVADFLDRAWLRRQRVAPLAAAHADLVNQIRATGVAATTPGSGGAVVAFATDDDQLARATTALTAMHCPYEVVTPI